MPRVKPHKHLKFQTGSGYIEPARDRCPYKSDSLGRVVIYQAYRVGWGKKVLGNGYTMLVATLGLFTVMHLGLPDEVSIAFLPFILLVRRIWELGHRSFVLRTRRCNDSATGPFRSISYTSP